MVDKIKPLKIENTVDGSQDDQGFPTQTDPMEDYLAARGMAFQNSDNHLIDTVENEIAFLDPINGRLKLSEVLAGPGGVTNNSHKGLDHLIHNIAETSYLEITRTAGRVTSEIWWTNNSKILKIREITYSYITAFISSVVYKQYDPSGTLLETYTETYNRTGPFVTSIDGVLT